MNLNISNLNVNQVFIGNEPVLFVESENKKLMQCYDWSKTEQQIINDAKSVFPSNTIVSADFQSGNQQYVRIGELVMEDKWQQTQFYTFFCMPGFTFYLDEDLFSERERMLYWNRSTRGTLTEATMILMAWIERENDKVYSLSDFTFVKNEEWSSGYYYCFTVKTVKYAVGFDDKDISLLIGGWMSDF